MSFFPALTLLATLAVPQEVEYEKLNKSSPTQKLAFDWEGRDASGAAMVLARGEFVFTRHPLGGVQLTFPTAEPPQIGANQYLVTDVTRTVPLGTYELWAVAVSTEGVRSEKSNSLFVEVVNNPVPLPLKNLRIVE